MEKTATANLKEALCNTPELKTLDVRDGAGQIVVGVDNSLERWRETMLQQSENNDWHLGRYETGCCPKVQQRYDTGKRDSAGMMRAFEKFTNYVSGVRMLMEKDVNTVVHQLAFRTKNLPESLLTHWIAWI
jgi:hypothetical protein